MKERMRRIKEIFRHKMAFIKTEKQYRGKLTRVSITHDLDKLLWLLTPMPTQWVRDRHKMKAHHHNVTPESPDKIFEEKVIDWECARATKRKSQMTAWEYFNHIMDNVNEHPRFMAAFEKLGLKEDL